MAALPDWALVQNAEVKLNLHHESYDGPAKMVGKHQFLDLSIDQLNDAILNRNTANVQGILTRFGFQAPVLQAELLKYQLGLACSKLIDMDSILDM